MYKQKPFPFSLLILGVLITLHSVGSYLSWYWVYPWFDIVVHIFSGLWIGLVMLWLASILGLLNLLNGYKLRSFFIAIISALFIGIVWELVENLTQVTYTSAAGYSFNTAQDIFNDAIGGVLAYLYFVRTKKCLDNTCDVLHPFYNQTGIINK